MKIQEVLEEASLNRIKDHIDRATVDGEVSWGIITAHKDDKTRGENKAATIQLKTEIQGEGLGFIYLKGIAQNDDGTKTKEEAMFIVGVPFYDMKKWAKKYKQDSFIYQGEETSGQVVLFDKHGKKLQEFGSFHPMKTGIYYSTLRNGKSFVFESSVMDTPALNILEEGQGQTEVGIHFSGKSGLTKLQVDKHGTGIRGAEKNRLISNPDYYVKGRVYFYIKRFFKRKEPGLGPYRYEAKLTKLYDVIKDPDNLYKKAEDVYQKENEPTKPSKYNIAPSYDRDRIFTIYEKLIKDSGYKGIVNYSINNVAMFYDVPVTQEDPDINKSR